MLKQNFRWTPELAYAVGLITTDGSLSKDGRHIVLRSVDLEQLETFKRCLNLQNAIGAPKTGTSFGGGICYRVQFGNVQFYRWLVKIGLSPAKTYTIGELKVPDKYFRDFLRGHLDGDGCIVSYQDAYNAFKNPEYVYLRLILRFLSASRAHILWIHEKLLRILKIRGEIVCKPPRRPGGVQMWELKFMKKNSIKLLHWMYYSPTVPALSRKRQKAQTVLNAIAAQVRKPYVRREQLCRPGDNS